MFLGSVSTATVGVKEMPRMPLNQMIQERVAGCVNRRLSGGLGGYTLRDLTVKDKTAGDLPGCYRHVSGSQPNYRLLISVLISSIYR